jgi:hypothetical protein
MPARTVSVRLNEIPPGEALATLMANVAYPYEEDRLERERFARALWWAILIERASEEKAWGQTIQSLRPSLFLDDDTTLLSSLKRGTKLLSWRLNTAGTFLMPHLRELRTGKLFPIRGGFAPTVENMSMLVMGKMGWKGDSVATFKSKIWKTTKPVAHLAFVLNLRHKLEAALAKKQNRDFGRVYYRQFFRGDLAIWLELAENCRNMLPSIKQFKIKEEETIQFLPA